MSRRIIRQITADVSEEITVSVETLVYTYQNTQRHIPEDRILQSHHHENLKYQVSHDSRCASRDSYRAPPEYKTKAFQLEPTCLIQENMG
jgi:hypothetical protein